MSDLTLFNPKQERNEAKVDGIHKKYRGKIDPSGQVHSKRRGSGLRKHLGDHITDVGTKPNELRIREVALEEKKKKK
jgi:hypothetical protein